MSSVVRITYNTGTDVSPNEIEIQQNVIFSDASFEMQMNAVPGTAKFRVKDPTQTYGFVTGHEIRLYVDDIPMWGGYVLRVNMGYPFDADDTSSPATYEKRIWTLECTDYNILFDNRILRNTSNYVGHIPNDTGYDGNKMDGWILRTALTTWCDFPAGFDTTTKIDDVRTCTEDGLAATKYKLKQQGTKLRDQFADMAALSGSVFYIGAEKAVHYHLHEDVTKDWGFSDHPNHTTSFGFREVTATEDGSLIINDALIWGGAAPAVEQVVMARYQDEVDQVTSTSNTYVQHGTVSGGSSIDIHGRWQLGETHFGEMNTLGYVRLRANQIVNSGAPGQDAYGRTKGLRYPQWSFEFTWFAEHIPLQDHIVAGDIVNIELDTFSVNVPMPCRSLRIAFPTLTETGETVVQMTGEFSLQYTDPVALWQTILKQKPSTIVGTVTGVNNDSGSAGYGDYGSFIPYESPDGNRRVFSLRMSSGSVAVGYIANTLIVYVDGFVKRSTVDYTETDPANGIFTMTTAPAVGAELFVICRTLETSTEPPQSIPPQESFAYYISPTGSDSNPGTFTSPWATLGKFVALPPSPGDILYCRGGTYTGTGNRAIYIRGISGTASSPITVRNYPGETPIFDGQADGVTRTWRVFMMLTNTNAPDPGGSGSSYWVFDGINCTRIEPTDTGAIDIGNWNDGDATPIGHNTIRNCDLGVGPFVPGDGGEHIIYIGASSSSNVIEHNILRHQYDPVDHPSYDGGGVHLYHWPSGVNNIIRNNVFVECGKGIVLWDYHAQPNPTLTATVTHNTFIRCGTNIDARYHGALTIRDNAGENGDAANVIDVVNVDQTTSDHNFWGQSFDSNFYLLPGETGINAASDGSDAGALNS